MKQNNNPHFEQKGQDFIQSLRPLGMSHLVYGFCDNVENIAKFGLDAKRGKSFSLLPYSLHRTLEEQGLDWEHCFPLEHCWQNEADLEFPKVAIGNLRQQKIHRLWQEAGFAAGVALPIRAFVDPEVTIGAAVLLFAQHVSVQDFHAMYQRHHHALRRLAEGFDAEIRRSCMKSVFPLTKGECKVLRDYRGLGDAARIAELNGTTVRTVQLSLQKARMKLQVKSNTEALNFCRSFGLLQDAED